MGPVTKHLHILFPQLPYSCDEQTLHWTFDAKIKELGPELYNKILPLHPILNVEYSILCNQLRQDFLAPEQANKERAIKRLTAALMLCELLEHVHCHYLIVPREVVRLRKQQEMFRTLLGEIAGYTFASKAAKLATEDAVAVGYSTSQQVRELTIQMNWYRILLTRSKRFLNVLNNVVHNSQEFSRFIALIDKYSNPFFGYLGWLFHLPRLFTNSFLIMKHTIPGNWMDADERSLAWTTRLLTQVQRRWFELGNDSVWVAVGILNFFVLTGALAPIALYLSAAAFAFDVINAAMRAYIELSRLSLLQKQYEEQLFTETDEDQRVIIREHQAAIEERIHFERLRYGLHVSGTVVIFSAMSLALPVFAISPAVVLASAIFLLLLWGITYSLTQKLETYRPKDNIEVTANVSKLGFFAIKTNQASPALSSTLEIEGSIDSPPLFI